jgi:hypothetical protein
MHRRMRRTRTFEAITGCTALLAASCMLGNGSRTAQGELYTSGNPTYDAFFRDVHQQQVNETTWGEEERGTHKPLVTALSLEADAPDVTIVQATHESSSKVAKQPGSVRLDLDGAAPHVVASGGAGDGGPLFRAVEDTAHQELDRAKRLHAVEPTLDALAKQEADLETHVKADFAKYGNTKANDVASELAATRDVLTKLKAHAQTGARASEDFVADLGRALETAAEEKAARTDARRARTDKAERGEHAEREKRKHEDTGATASTKSPPASSDPASAPAPKPAPPPPKPADTGEVFTP